MNMDKGIELYKEFIDNFMTMSENCVDAVSVKKGNVVGCQAQEIGINDVLKKLSSEDRGKLSQFISDVYSSGVFDVLDNLEWLRECREMEMKIDNEVLPMGKFEGIQNAYVGRKSGWQWTE